MGEIARIFTDSVGPNLLLVFLAGALAATYSTAFKLLRWLAPRGGRLLPKPVSEDGQSAPDFARGTR